MKTATKVSAYGLALAIMFGGAWVAGAAVGPLGGSMSPSVADHSARHDAAQPVDTRLPGLAAADNGYRLELPQSTLTAGHTDQFRFRILGPANRAVTTFDVEHEKRLHFVVVRRDGSGYQHLHPTMAADGTWSVPLTLPSAGSYRVFTDFKAAGGVKMTLGTDIQVPGRYEPATLGDPVRTVSVDGYEVTLNGDLKEGSSSPVTATVTRNGQPVADLQPYLGAYGHLVTLRATDFGYLHVHPLGEPGDGTTTAGPQVRFAVEVPTPGRYRLFLDFQHEGDVHTAEFSVDTHEETHR
jgi:hypothetical protein